MKKIILASVALISVFASCKKEDIRTVYRTDPAEVNIEVKVLDALTDKDVTSQATIKAELVDKDGGAIEVVGNKVTIKGVEKHNFAIPQQNVKISVSYGVGDGSATVKVPSVVEGGIAAYTVTVVNGHPIDPEASVSYGIREAGNEIAGGKKGYLELATHEYNGSKWCINDTEFVLFGLTKYHDLEGCLEDECVLEVNEGLADVDLLYVQLAYETLKAIEPHQDIEKELGYVVSAFSYYNVQVAYHKVTQFWDFVRINKLTDGSTLETVIGSCEIVSDLTSVLPLEIASPSHASHYVQGHGVDDPHYSHAHGRGGYNAGGGIVVAD